MVPYLRLPELCDVPSVVDLVDVDSEKWLEYSQGQRGPRSWLYRLENRRLRKLEQGLTSWTRAVTLVSDAEADIYRGFCDPGTVSAVPNGVDLDYFQPRPVANESGCVFVGAFDYHPNIDGACWFAREVWPQIVRARPAATLSLVGRRPVSAVRELAAVPGVKVAGQVPDVRPYLSQAAMALVPLRIARGVQNKVLEALAMGKAVIASPPAVEGIHVEPGQHLLTAATPSEWAAAVVRLLDDATLRASLGEAGRRYVEENHRWEHCLEPLGRFLGVTNGCVRNRDCSLVP
jgi:sugar transferase (PEP-CTERM/EpsH1 system associated)